MAKLEFNNSRWSFTDAAGNGWYNLGFSLNGEELDGYEVETVQDGINVTAQNGTVKQQLEFRQRGDCLTIRRLVANIGADELSLADITDGMCDETGRLSLNGMHEFTLRFMHTSNMRTEVLPDSRPQYPYLRPVPYNPVHFNIGEGNDFPAFVLCSEDALGDGNEERALLVEGDLDQTRFARSWWLGLHGAGERGKVLRTYEGRQQYPLAAPFVLSPGESVQVSHVFYQICRNTHPQDAYQDYVSALREEHAFAVDTSSMRHGSVFCTWNYGTGADINEELLMRRATALKDNVPECTHFLIDDGYQQDRGDRNGPLDCFYPDPVNRWDREKFPSGMANMAEQLAGLGLNPCIWLSPAVYLDSPLAGEHPEWLLCDADGDPALLGKSTFLDLSVGEAREFFLAVLDALFVEWGYRGIKFDFMSHWFTLERARFRNGGSGPYWRDWVFHEIRKRIGPDGLFMTCIAMSMGNPFPGQYANCYRCGCDIHDGTWREQINACKATLPQVLLEGRKTMLLNMDSAGFGDVVPENEQLFRLTWIFITQGILELGGPVEEMPDEQLALWRRLTANADRGHRVRCLDERAFTGDGLPEILLVAYPEDSPTYRRGVRAHIALFNWQEHGKPVGGDAQRMGLRTDESLTDYWTGEKKSLAKEGLHEFLSPRSAKLYELVVV